MSTIISNSNSVQKVTPAIIIDNINKAKHSFFQSKEAAGEAAARAYMVWGDTMSPTAHKDSRDWIDAQIAKRNHAIEEHNKEEKALREKAKKFVNGKLADDNWLNSKPETQAEREELAKEKAMLIALNELTSQQWTARRKVAVEARDNASKFTKVVKYVFEFEYATEASVTSRYATVMEWIDTRFAGVVIHDVTELTDAIKAAGGFEAVLNEQRGNKSSAYDAGETDREAIAAALATQTKAAIKTAAAKAIFEMEVNDVQENIVFLVGRFVDGKVEVVGEMPMSADKLDEAVAKFCDDTVLPTHANTEFVARVLQLGKLVEEGKASDATEDGLKAGKRELVQRAFTLVPNKGSGVEVLVSAVFADASIIVKAKPNLDHVVLGAVATPVMMKAADLHALEKMLGDRATRRLVDVTPDINDGELSWIACNSALAANKSANAERRQCFEPVIDQEVKPLDVDVFKTQFAVEVEVSDLRALYKDYLKAWKEVKDAKKNQKPMTLTFKDNKVNCQIDTQLGYEVPSFGANPIAVQLTFRPRDIHALVLELTKQTVKAVKVSGDPSGLLCVTWADHYGQYCVYLPTATKENKLEHRRVAPLQIEVDMAVAA